jgi:hypothetical protein
LTDVDGPLARVQIRREGSIPWPSKFSSASPPSSGSSSSSSRRGPRSFDEAFINVNDFHKWVGWSPWEALDPTMKKTYEGAPAGVGSIYSWVGNPKVGEGSMTIDRSEAPRLVGLKLEFFKPWKATNATTFSFDAEPEGTKVTWAMDGTNNFSAKAFSLFVSMDKLLGRDFERGLAALKRVAEKDPATA